jgi:hypothetical protein
MGGLVLDIYIAWLIRFVMETWRRRGTSRWTAAQGIIDSVDESRWWSMYVVSITYHFEAGGTQRYGSDAVSFLTKNSSYEFRRKIHEGMSIRLRVNPVDSETSVMA